MPATQVDDSAGVLPTPMVVVNTRLCGGSNMPKILKAFKQAEKISRKKSRHRNKISQKVYYVIAGACISRRNASQFIPRMFTIFQPSPCARGSRIAGGARTVSGCRAARS